MTDDMVAWLMSKMKRASQEVGEGYLLFLGATLQAKGVPIQFGVPPHGMQSVAEAFLKTPPAVRFRITNQLVDAYDKRWGTDLRAFAAGEVAAGGVLGIEPV